ncbi:minor capsid protein [Bacillus thuringiensis]|uniref:minor capsid protein n=1 Tax=Bacillus thuringiensis TaxID=1428 RepID=UPI000BF33A54|nr:minor capsid protein [Bacillus thuringiensis]PEV02211.1 minor capsid protein [Bacillus thuringiensis]PFS55859.1 minor capsid protein [Bacillus thuringiensis]
MDFIFRLVEFLPTKVTLNAPLSVGLLTDKASSISIRQTPSSTNNRYLNKDKIELFSFQISVKDTDHKKTINTIQSIADVLDDLESDDIKSNDDSFYFIDCSTYVSPNFVEKTDHNEYIYTALFNAELERRAV